MEIFNKSATELGQLLQSKEVSSLEVVDSFLGRIDRVDPLVEAFLTVTAEQARKQAIAIDEKRAKGETLGNLAGVPIALKDNICTNGVATTCASKMLENFKPPYNATVVDKLEKQGIISLGKVNMDEFAMGSSTESSYFKTTKNPWDLSKVPGGSSGGSAAAVAAGLAPFSLGTDTGGSIRLPASYCGLVGFKPTYGMISRYGVTAFSSSLDQVGPIARTVEDVAALFDIIKGHDTKDATSLTDSLGVADSRLSGSVKGVKIGVPKEYFLDPLVDEVHQGIKEALTLLVQAGAIVEEVSLPSTEYALSAYYIISSAEASSNLGRFDGVRYGFRAEGVTDVDELFNLSRTQGFGEEVKRRIMLGNFVLSAANYDTFCKTAIALRKRVSDEFDTVFANYDVLITPTSPSTAFAIGKKSVDLLADYKADTCTITANLAGLPALSIPTGNDSTGMPMGMQLIGPRFSEDKLLAVASTYEKLVGGFLKLPELEGGA